MLNKRIANEIKFRSVTGGRFFVRRQNDESVMVRDTGHWYPIDRWKFHVQWIARASLWYHELRHR